LVSSSSKYDNSSYQVFLRFNFEFNKPKLKAKLIKATKPTLEVETIEDAKKSDNTDQTIDELLAADVEALK